MKHKLLLLSIILSTFTFAQQLTIDETINYINTNLQDQFKLKITSERNFKVSQDKSSNQYWVDFNSELNKFFPDSSKNGNSYGTEWAYSGKIDKINISKSIDYNNEFLINFKCNDSSPCYYVIGKRYSVSFKNNVVDSKTAYLIAGTAENKYQFKLSFVNENKRDKIFNAFKYLIESIKVSPEFQNQDSDPFSVENFSALYSVIIGNKIKDEVKLNSDRGTYSISVSVNGLTKQFVLDSGASEISLSTNFERDLISQGLIKKEDYLESGLYKIADGSIVTQRRINLKEVKVGAFTVKNVTASVGNGNIPLLLGKSFLDKFSKWSIDNSSEKLILEK
ncbi:retropepsin-like aspartic protease family protein [Kaistella jeonii]|uniref:Peptidase A2 domain-containing protein n=1 Tax=Kaistella jeonii TaxID=266749 RepID=A0A0C1FPV9_9FLAO|nr:retropepsin-like aspartic protease [Kaistella jeonii]KIA89904.1 hypothetical protein OA86_04635 [Kaistella jeonii]SFB81444.1 clan AA aspartic protease, TIGR02281 family [Kaistella jeonii]VEI96147.1 Predicted aspartyl protease [Kaistella jeonii]